MGNSPIAIDHQVAKELLGHWYHSQRKTSSSIKHHLNRIKKKMGACFAAKYQGVVRFRRKKEKRLGTWVTERKKCMVRDRFDGEKSRLGAVVPPVPPSVKVNCRKISHQVGRYSRWNKQIRSSVALKAGISDKASNGVSWGILVKIDWAVKIKFRQEFAICPPNQNFLNWNLLAISHDTPNKGWMAKSPFWTVKNCQYSRSRRDILRESPRRSDQKSARRSDQKIKWGSHYQSEPTVTNWSWEKDCIMV